MYTVDVITTNFTKRYHVRTFLELKSEISKDLKNEVDWDRTKLRLVQVRVSGVFEVSVLGERRPYLFHKTVHMNKELDLNTAILDCVCTIDGRIVFKRE